MKTYSNLFKPIQEAARVLSTYGQEIHTERWQGKEIKNEAQMAMIEYLNFSFQGAIPYDLDELREQVKPNLPWADFHFDERMSGLPLNPGKSYLAWPFYKMDKDMRKHNDQFSHTYMERLWPKFANQDTKIGENFILTSPQGRIKGIRYIYGDFHDVFELLLREPDTRQAFLPIWFPEDTGATAGQRVPCTIGYHFIMRNNFLHCVYYIRSCDFMRHFRDDIYLASRKVLYLLSELQKDFRGKENWKKVHPGTLTMHITSLHAFSSERKIIAKMV